MILSASFFSFCAAHYKSIGISLNHAHIKTKSSQLLNLFFMCLSKNGPHHAAAHACITFPSSKRDNGPTRQFWLHDYQRQIYWLASHDPKGTIASGEGAEYLGCKNCGSLPQDLLDWACPLKGGGHGVKMAAWMTRKAEAAAMAWSSGPRQAHTPPQQMTVLNSEVWKR
uniref:Uncharacterized protein n=1 Tax=Cannabis sativa TaxID=3483 RepID=A0A803PQC5_CANSA